MKYETLQRSLNDRILTVTLDRPRQLNAFTPTMGEELITEFGRADQDDDVAAVVVTGAGRAFCAGMDLSGDGNVFGLNEDRTPTLADLDADPWGPEIMRGVRDIGGRVTLAIANCRKPVIAAINGPAVGIGATMTLAMDFRLASEKARIGFVFGKIGIVPEACSTWFLPRLVGLQQALEWAYTGDIFTAAEGKAAGLLRDVVAPDDLIAVADRLAHRLTDSRSPVGIALTRQMMYRDSALPDPFGAHRVESLAMFYTSIGDGKEGVQAFLEKREPVFRSKASAMPEFYQEWLSERPTR